MTTINKLSKQKIIYVRPTIEILVEERRLTGFTGVGSAWLSEQMKRRVKQNRL